MTDRLRDELMAIVGDAGLVESAADRVPYLTEWRGQYQGEARCIVRPADTGEVAAVVACCARHGAAIVPQGGNTGLTGGAVSHRDEVLLSLSRMQRVREIDAANFSMTVDAGCTLAQAQQAADAQDLLLALSLSSEGSCQIGGNLSTNAGGVNVVKYGCAREQTLGIEAVLASGEVLSQLGGLRKNTAGYDLKQWLIGAEGTLGIITGATLALQPKPERRELLWLALEDHDAVLRLFAAARRRFGNSIAAFELVPDIAVEFVTRHIPDSRRPLDASLHLLIELHGGEAEISESAIMTFITQHLDSGTLSDAVVAQSGRERESLWALRHRISEAQRREGASIKHDIALPLGALPAFITSVTASVQAVVDGVRVVCFGHIGDGNLHFNLSQPADMAAETFRTHTAELNAIVHSATLRYGGTISAEHGIGLLKRDILESQAGPVAMDMMRSIKRALDPSNLMNPGKVL